MPTIYKNLTVNDVIQEIKTSKNIDVVPSVFPKAFIKTYYSK